MTQKKGKYHLQFKSSLLIFFFSNFQASYFLNGVSVPYAHLNASFFELLSNVDVVYLGNTTEKPKDLVGTICKLRI